MVKIQGVTHRGMVREHNEDRYAGNLLEEHYGYALVCDGMGGENGGSIASTLACEEIRRTVENSYRPQLDEKTVYNILETAVANANTIVFARAGENPELSGMGTTVSLALLCDEVCYIANVGDSRVYLLR
ncbi:MAG: protein phosphatase 2C domain-containing protein, partial [Angelakisella sp.]